MQFLYVSLSFFTGYDWAAVYLCTSRGVWCYCLFNDWISMDCRQILLVSIFYVLHSLVLHLLWHDVCGCDTNTPNCFHCFRCVLWNMEPLFWICDPKNCKCCWLLIIFLTLCFFSTRHMLMTYNFFFFPFLSLPWQLQRIPVWWRWYCWICPTAWTLYGLIASQFGDLKNKLDTGLTVEDFVESYFGYRHDFLGVVAAVVVGFAVFFAFIFAFAIRTLNFQKR